MDEISVTYREPAPPPPRVFALDGGAAAPLGLLAGLVTAGISLAALALGAGLFVFFFFAMGPAALGYLLGGAPRAIEVHHDRVVLRFWLRRTKTLAASELRVPQVDDELVLVDGTATYAIAREHFTERSFEACAHALREVVANTVTTGAR